MTNPKTTGHAGITPFDHVKEIGIDKLKLCIPSACVSDALAALLHEQCDKLKSKPGTHTLSSKGKAFQKRLSVSVCNERVVIECKPNKATHPWAATVEFNPNPYLRNGEKAIANLGHFFRFLLGHEADHLLSQAVVTTLHVNIDYTINPLEGTLVVAKGKRGGAKVLYNFDGHGVVGSLYVGVLGSDCRLCIYDKAAEVLHRELAPHAHRVLAALASDKWNIEVSRLREKLAAQEHWRLEVRCEPKDAVPVPGIAGFASCFDGIRFLRLPPDVAPFDDSLGRAFIANARNDGINVALQALDANDRRRFTRAINRLQDFEWFNAELLRDAIQQAIGKLAPLFARPQRRLEVAQKETRTSSAPVRRARDDRVVFKRTGGHFGSRQRLPL